MNMTIFTNRTFADIMKPKWSQVRRECLLIQWCCLCQNKTYKHRRIRWKAVWRHGQSLEWFIHRQGMWALLQPLEVRRDNEGSQWSVSAWSVDGGVERGPRFFSFQGGGVGWSLLQAKQVPGKSCSWLNLITSYPHVCFSSLSSFLSMTWFWCELWM